MKSKHKTGVGQVRNLIRIALITSPVMGVLTAMPTFKHLAFSFQFFLPSALLSTVFALSIWSINAFLVYLSEQNGLQWLKNKVRYVLSFTFSILFSFVFWLVSRFLILFFFEGFRSFLFESHGGDHHFPLATGFFLNLIILIIQEIALMKDKKAQIELENAQLKTKNTEAFYQQLKQQIHPHFLFNSLNILKTLIKKNPDVAVDYVVKLSDFLRASISSNNANTARLADELKLCLDYLEMQKLRFGDALDFVFDIPEPITKSGFVPVFSIQLLLENALKHNSLTEEAPLHIQVFYQEGKITVTNNLQPKLTSEISTGLGLANLSERYKILSGDEVVIESGEKNFSVTINILSE
ncbi:MAG TPA: histidine kinase [Prolixibacteraceae bacterium]|nr:histidine kinase [Prolixibacteraceae bacterium]